MVRNLFLVSTACAWIAFVIGSYLLRSGDAPDGFAVLGSLILLAAVVPIARRINGQLTAVHVLALGLIVACTLASFGAWAQDPAYRAGPSLYRELTTGQILAEEETHLEADNLRLLVPRGGVATHFDFDSLPAALREGFKRPTPLAFMAGFAARVARVILELAVILGAALGLGLRISAPREGALRANTIAIALVVGLAALMLVAWGLAIAHLLAPTVVWGVLIATFATHAGWLWRAARAIGAMRWRPSTARTSTLVMLTALGLLQVANLVDNMTPVPRGWDALNQYARVAAQLAQQAGAIGPTYSYFWECLASLGTVAFGDLTVCLMLMAFVPSALVSALTYLLARRRFDVPGSLFAVCVVSFAPMTVFHGAQEHKVDLAAFVLGLTALLLASHRRMVMAGLLCGLMVAVKATGLLLVCGLAAAILHKFGLRAGTVAVVRMLMAAAVAWLPFGAKNAFEAPSLTIQTAIMGLPAHKIDYEALARDTGLESDRYVFRGGHEETERYLLLDGPADVLALPWTLTMQTAVLRDMHVDPGFVPLVLLPAVLWYLLFSWWRRRTLLSAMATFGVVYWLLWGLTCKGVLWYGLPGLIAFGIAGAALAESSPGRSPWGRWVAGALVLAWLAVGLSQRLANFGQPALLLFAGGVIDEMECTRAVLPLAPDVARATARDDSIVLQIGTGYAFFVPRSFERVQQDPFCDHMYRLFLERDGQLTLERLRHAGIGYVLYDRSLYAGAESTELPARLAAVEPFLFRRLRVVASDVHARHFLFKVPH